MDDISHRTADDRLAYHMRNHGLDRTVDECERCARAVGRAPWTVVDGHYPGFRELHGASFKVSVVMSATDVDFDMALRREADLQLMAAAPDLLEALELMFERAPSMDGEAIDKARKALEKARG